MTKSKTVYLVSSGDLRLAANQVCWPAQQEMESQIIAALNRFGWSAVRAHGYDEKKRHGLIDSQRMGIEVFRSIDANMPVIVAESMWQYSHHVLAGLITHRGPILTVANWSGQWPGLVGMLNLNGSLTKAGVRYSTLWSESFSDKFFLSGLEEWLSKGSISHDLSHVHKFNPRDIAESEYRIALDFANDFRRNKAIMGVFDEGCMGMYNAIVPDDLLYQTGVFKERLSQSALYAEMRTVTDSEAIEVVNWLLAKGMKFAWGKNPETELTKEQTLEQCKMYIAATRMADRFGCDTIGIQYQLGLMDLTAASDLAEGLLNNTDRPPVFSTDGRELYPGRALPHFNEADECAGLDSLITYHLWEKLGMDGANTLHDIRWGQQYSDGTLDAFVWVFLISGAAPPSHFIGGYKGASSERQPPMYFKLGGGTLKGVSKPGFIVWSRIFIMDNKLHCDLGVGSVVQLPQAETDRRWAETTSQWPIMHGVLKGVTRDQMMARHKANHIHVVYANDHSSALRACRIKAAVMAELGIETSICGDVDLDT